MADRKMSRKKMISNSFLAFLGTVSGVGLKKNEDHGLPAHGPHSTEELPFRISMNTSTISAYDLPVDKQIDLVAEAGFDGIELWVRDIEAYFKAGGSAAYLSERLNSGNIVLENMIGFAPWISDDPATREQGVKQLRNEMEMMAELGGQYIAAPVQGIESLDKTKFEDYVRRYLDILEVGDEIGVVPALEIWGTGALHNLADCAQIAIATGHPKATILLDFYHIYRGGNDWDTLDLINGKRLPVFHINDYPETPPREQLTDADRIFPGDGICPFNEIIPSLYKAGFRGGFSVELFNKEYWSTMDARAILKESYEKTYRTLKDSMVNINY